MRRFALTASALALFVLLVGCGATTIRTCGTHNGIFGCVNMSTGGQPAQQYPAQPVLIYQPHQEVPPVLFQQPGVRVIPVVPLRRTGPCVGYRLIPNIGYVCQGYQWGALPDGADPAKDFGLEIAQLDTAD